MAYEYEEEVKSVISTETVFSHEETEKEARVKELQEVYDKAKAFDKIVDIEDDFIKYHGFSPCIEEYAEEVEEIISEYMEGE